MKRIFDFIYYCFYSTISLKSLDGPSRSSAIFAVTNSFYLISIYIIGVKNFGFPFPKGGLAAAIFGVVIFIINIAFNEYYLVKSKRYDKIITMNDEKYKKKTLLKVLAITFFLCSVVLFLLIL